MWYRPTLFFKSKLKKFNDCWTQCFQNKYHVVFHGQNWQNIPKPINIWMKLLNNWWMCPWYLDDKFIISYVCGIIPPMIVRFSPFLKFWKRKKEEKKGAGTHYDTMWSQKHWSLSCMTSKALSCLFLFIVKRRRASFPGILGRPTCPFNSTSPTYRLSILLALLPLVRS